MQFLIIGYNYSLTATKVLLMPKTLIYTHSKVVKLTEVQYKTLKKLEGYNVRVCDFIRQAIDEKLQREKIEIVKPKIKNDCPF